MRLTILHTLHHVAAFGCPFHVSHTPCPWYRWICSQHSPQAAYIRCPRADWLVFGLLCSGIEIHEALVPAVIIAQHTVAALPARAAAQAQLLAQGLDLVDRWVYGTPVSLGALQDTQRALCNYRIPLGTMLHRLLGAILHVEATDTLRALRPALIADLVRWSLLTIAAPQRTIADNAAKDRIRHAVPWARVAAQL